VGVLSRLKRLPKAGQVFVSSLAEGVREDVGRQGSAGQRFADAPLGQYYLPSQAQTALRFLGAPSPRKVVRDTKGVVENPKSVGNWAAEANNALGIAGLPALAVGGAGAARGALRGASALAATRSLPLGERIALAARAAKGGYQFHGTTQAAAEAIRAEGFRPSTLPRIGGPGEQVVYGTSDVKTAMRYAQHAVSREGGGRPAVVAFKPGQKAVAAGAGGHAFPAAGAQVSKPIQLPNVAGIKQRVVEAMGAADRGRPAELTQKIAEIKRELAQMGDAGGNVVSLPFRGTTAEKLSQVQAELQRLRSLQERQFPSTLRKASSKLPRNLKAGERGALRLSGDEEEHRQEIYRLARQLRESERFHLSREPEDVVRKAAGPRPKRGTVPDYELPFYDTQLAQRELAARRVQEKAGLEGGEYLHVKKHGRLAEVSPDRPAVPPAISQSGRSILFDLWMKNAKFKRANVHPARLPRN
jgi:hypothetical protein